MCQVLPRMRTQSICQTLLLKGMGLGSAFLHLNVKIPPSSGEMSEHFMDLSINIPIYQFHLKNNVIRFFSQNPHSASEPLKTSGQKLCMRYNTDLMQFIKNDNRDGFLTAVWQPKSLDLDSGINQPRKKLKLLLFTTQQIL